MRTKNYSAFLVAKNYLVVTIIALNQNNRLFAGIEPLS